MRRTEATVSTELQTRMRVPERLAQKCLRMAAFLPSREKTGSLTPARVPRHCDHSDIASPNVAIQLCTPATVRINRRGLAQVSAFIRAREHRLVLTQAGKSTSATLVLSCTHAQA